MNSNSNLHMMYQKNTISRLSKSFALRVIKLYKYLLEERHEYIMSKQVYRSGTSIGANIAESRNAQSKADFITKLSISLKEAAETKFWLKLFHKTDLIDDKMFYSMNTDVKDIISLLVTILRKLKGIDNNEKSEHRQ